ncbi:hypothetical protein CANTEDRAFT_135013 [Yamadazyma tenuis ATCC 10573]|uniref:Uncharacterized protein n=2 Tax=Candida tenuis TaxID=2315449 RepID=G3B5B6_CANTC|nr:uncharacterized protein CANTEDRAFT_135013 [Yamadazyma tenuis ATCC 10573]EGV63177.1 hypothetical protein CANTEDRAFT_135013 [Yamadazyma tenuis ATCC 10573]
MTTRNFQWFKKSLNHLKHTYIYYDLKTTDEIQRKPGLYSQIFCIPNKYLASTFLSLDIPGDEIVVKVFDPGYYFISNWSYKYQYDDVRYNIQQYFENDIEYYQKVNDFNQSHRCKIDTLSGFNAGFCSFWRDQSKPKDSNNYIASGLTIFMPKLTKKPKTQEDYLKGLKGLITMENAGLADFAVNYENMFMDKGKFIFSNYSSPSTRPSSAESDDSQELESLQTQKIIEFAGIWRKKDPEYSNIIAKESVNLFEEEIQREITESQQSRMVTIPIINREKSHSS